MKRLLCALILAALPALAAGPASTIKQNATVYIAPMDGFGSDLQAAFLKKHVPLVMIDDQTKADYIIDGHNNDQKAGWAKTIFFSPAPSEHASITLKMQIRAPFFMHILSIKPPRNAGRNLPQNRALNICARQWKQSS